MNIKSLCKKSQDYTTFLLSFCAALLLESKDYPLRLCCSQSKRGQAFMHTCICIGTPVGNLGHMRNLADLRLFFPASTTMAQEAFAWWPRFFLKRHRKVGGVKNRDCRFQAELCMQQAENCESCFRIRPFQPQPHIEDSSLANREFEKGCKSYRSLCKACSMYLQVGCFPSKIDHFH